MYIHQNTQFKKQSNIYLLTPFQPPDVDKSTIHTYTTLHYITIHYITLPCNTLHYISLHVIYITYICIYKTWKERQLPVVPINLAQSIWKVGSINLAQEPPVQPSGCTRQSANQDTSLPVGSPSLQLQCVVLSLGESTLPYAMAKRLGRSNWSHPTSSRRWWGGANTVFAGASVVVNWRFGVVALRKNLTTTVFGSDIGAQRTVFD